MKPTSKKELVAKLAKQVIEMKKKAKTQTIEITRKPHQKYNPYGLYT